MSEPCELLPWDSDFFGLRIGRVRGCRLTEPLAREIRAWAAAQRIDCLYFLGDSSDTATLRLAPRHGFDLVDLRVTLAAAAAVPPRQITGESPLVRPAQSADVEALRRIASRSHHDSRFYTDGRFDAGRVDELFATWIEKSCGGYADVVLLAEVDGRPSGYITGHMAGPERGGIGLVGIDSTRRRQGCGRALVRSALDWFRQHGAPHVTVVTQGRNAQALSFYQRNGFEVAEIALWYHRWSSPAEPA